MTSKFIIGNYLITLELICSLTKIKILNYFLNVWVNLIQYLLVII